MMIMVFHTAKNKYDQFVTGIGYWQIINSDYFVLTWGLGCGFGG
jgi:hypothetical protein